MRKIFSLFVTCFLSMGLSAQQLPATVQGQPYDFTKARNAGNFSGIMTLSTPRNSDFTMDDIEFWVGEGSKKAVLAIQWNESEETNALVWGYYFEGDKYGVDLVTDIAKADPRLYVMVQPTGLGYTVCGVGYDRDGNGEIALRKKSTGALIEPAEPGVFVNTTGAYDYDDYEAVDPDDYWGAGWYSSYWSYWVKEGNGDFGYSGLGASSRKLNDGSWDGWNFARNMQTVGFKPLASAPGVGYTSGTFFLDYDASNSSCVLEYLNQKGEWEHAIYQTANNGLKLDADVRFGTIFGENLYLASAAQGENQGDIIVTDAKKLIRKAVLENVDARTLVGISPEKGYIATGNGIYTMNLVTNSLGKVIPSTDGNGEIRSMLHTGNYVFAVQPSQGILVIDTKTDEVKTLLSGAFSSVAQSFDGNVWGAAGIQLVKINPLTLTTEVIELPAYCTIGSHTAFLADATHNALFWGCENAMDSTSIYRYEPGSSSSLESPFFSLPTGEKNGESFLFSGTGIALDYRTGELLVSAKTADATQSIFYYVDATTGQLTKTLKGENSESLSPVMILFPDAAPSITGLESSMTFALNDSPKIISLEGKITDQDNLDCNITTEVRSEDPSLVTAELKDGELVLSPQTDQSGETQVLLTASSNGKTTSKKISVSVTRALESIAFEKKEITLKKGQKDTLNVTFVPENATNQGLTWSYSTYSIASVTNGVVTARGVGEGYIYATSKEGNYVDTCKITVVNEPVTGISLNTKETLVYVNQKDTVQALLTPSDASNQDMKWTSKDATVASVPSYSGVITGKKEGETWIYVASTDGGFRDSCKVTVRFNPATAIVLSTKEMFLTAPKTQFLEVNFEPWNASNEDITLVSLNPEIASVDTYGWVKGLKGGETKIAVTSKDNPDLTDTCIVHVAYVAVTGISLKDKVKTLAVGKSYTLGTTLTPSGISNSNVTWSTADPGIATVSAYGSVKGVAPGKTRITVKTEDGGFADSCEVTVVDTIHVTGISLGKSEIWLKVGKSEQPSRTFTPSDATDQTYSYKSEDEEIATVSAYGSIKAIALGTTTVTVTTKDRGYTATCLVHVIPDVDSIAISLDSVKMVVGGHYALSVSVTPEEALQTVSWSTSNPSLATVDANGIVTALKAGEVSVFVTSTDNKIFVDTCVVKIENVLSDSIALSTSRKALFVEEGFQLSASVLPENTTDSRVRWTTSDYTVATVSSFGYVRAHRPGTAIIRAITQDGTGIESLCRVTVIIEPDGVSSVEKDGGYTIYMEGNNLVICGCEGYSFRLLTMDGQSLFNLEVKGSMDSFPVELPAGVYILSGTNGMKEIHSKVIVP